MSPCRCEGEESRIAQATGRDMKGRLSLIAYAIALAIAFVAPLLAILIYVAVSLRGRGIAHRPGHRPRHEGAAQPDRLCHCAGHRLCRAAAGDLDLCRRVAARARNRASPRPPAAT